jgi:hypothetical protein
VTRNDYPFGFRVVGPVTEARRLVDAAAAFSAHAACDPRSEIDREAYLSAFRFGTAFRDHLQRLGTPKGYAGPCWSPWLWLDIDREVLDAALADARKLVGFALERYRKLDDDDILVFFSGGKGYHVGVPLTHNPDPSPLFHRIARRLAEGLGASAGVRIDTSIYDRVKLFRAPNSRHPRSGLHKRRLTHAELMHLSAARVAELARDPAPFDVPVVGELVAEIEADWQEAAECLERDQAARQGRTHPAGDRLQRETLDFIRDGAAEGERHPRLFRAAANLREFDAPPALVHALLAEAALDCGLPPAEVARQIRCGIEHADRQRGGTGIGEGGAT